MNHRFHDREWVENYAETITERRPERVKMFAHIAAQIQAVNPESPTIVELASGPGLLAAALLQAFPTMHYIGLDFSQEMIQAARQRVADDRCIFLCKDLCSNTWHQDVPKNADAIISNMALHDLGSVENVEAVYKQAQNHLKPGGLLLNAELVLAADHENETDGGKCKTSRHLEIFDALGYGHSACTLDFGHYACVQAHRSVN